MSASWAYLLELVDFSGLWNLFEEVAK